jgi:hypothetical protein
MRPFGHADILTPAPHVNAGPNGSTKLDDPEGTSPPLLPVRPRGSGPLEVGRRISRADKRLHHEVHEAHEEGHSVVAPLHKPKSLCRPKQTGSRAIMAYAEAG